MTLMNNAIETLTHAFSEFKSNQEERLRSLEIASKRPEFEKLDSLTGAAIDQKKALLSYVRQGDTKLLERAKIKSLTAGVEADGGYLIPQVISDRIGRDLQELSPLRAISSVITISASAINFASPCMNSMPSHAQRKNY